MGLMKSNQKIIQIITGTHYESQINKVDTTEHGPWSGFPVLDLKQLLTLDLNNCPDRLTDRLRETLILKSADYIT